MDTHVSLGELQYVADSVLNGVRLDFRKFGETRNSEILPQKNERSDNFIQIRNGLSEIEASLRFKENARLLHSLNLITKEDFDKSEDKVPTLECSVAIPFDIETLLSEFFTAFNLSICIEIRIIKDDGGITSLLFSALRMLFSDVRAPVFKTMREYSERKISVPLPYCSTFAVKNDVFMADPTHIEEMCSDGVIHVLRDCDNHVIGVATSGAQINITDVLDFITRLYQ